MNFLKTTVGKPDPIEQLVSVIKYPDKIIVETYNRIKNSYSTRSPEVSVLEINASNQHIGEYILKHLSLSKTIDKESAEEIKTSNEGYKKITGLKTLKAQMKDALCVSIARKNDQINFYPTINGGTAGDRKGFGYTDEKITIEYAENAALMGDTFKLALEKCL